MMQPRSALLPALLVISGTAQADGLTERQAAFASLLATCAPQAPSQYLTALARTESGFHPYAVGDNTTRKSYRFETKEAAVAYVASAIATGRSVDVGLMQINSTNFGWLGLGPESALDPCINVASGARVLAAFSAYNTGSPTRGFANGYVEKVVANLRVVDQPAQPPAPFPPATPSWSLFAKTRAGNSQSLLHRKGD
jgi:type IV secretion system protein VirB1